MKTILFFLLFTLTVSAQTLTEKWNNITKQYEYYNSNGDLVGYKKYNSINKSWEYYDANPQPNYYTPKSNINVELTQRVLEHKQNQYDNNVKGVQNAINDLRNQVQSLGVDNSVIEKIKNRFNKEYIDKLNNTRYDYSNSNTASQIINWLYSGINSIISQEYQKYNSEIEQKEALKNQIQNELYYAKGGYTTTEVTEEKYNPFTKTYELISKDTTLTKVYFDIGRLHYFRQNFGLWRVFEWTYTHAADEFHILTSLNGLTLIKIGVRFDYIEFYEEKVGDVYTKRYTYKNLKKDQTVTTR